jgi:hypothetical protein
MPDYPRPHGPPAKAQIAKRECFPRSIVSFYGESLRLRGFPPFMANPRATALRCAMWPDKLDLWQAVFVRDLPQQRRPVSVPQHRELQRIVARLERLVP